MSERICTGCGASLPGSAARCEVCGTLAKGFGPSAYSDIGFPPQDRAENRSGTDRPGSGGRDRSASYGTRTGGQDRPAAQNPASHDRPGADDRDRRPNGMPRDIYDESLYPDRRLIPISASTFIGYYLLFLIPIIGLIVAIAWSFSRKGPINRRNFARATLVLMIFSIVVIAAAAYVIMIVLKDMGLYFL